MENIFLKKTYSPKGTIEYNRGYIIFNTDVKSISVNIAVIGPRKTILNIASMLYGRAEFQ
jgi:hypothetical protein